MTPTLLPYNKTQIDVPLKNDVGDDIKHLLEAKDIQAINAALAVNRPLLIYGEPGIGKSQLAKAVAAKLKRVYIPFVCDAHTESRDLLWHFDAVERLANAQVQGAFLPLVLQGVDDKSKAALVAAEQEKLALNNYIVPQALWWALNWGSADNMAKAVASRPFYREPCDPLKHGTVVLIDEIDKAGSDVPNGLLEVLGSGRFHPQGCEAVERQAETIDPLVIITSNEERPLPDAFVRRCLVLRLAFPAAEKEQVAFLTKRGEMNFPSFAEQSIEYQNESMSLLHATAKMLIADRQAAEAQYLRPLPGLAEYFDLLRGIQQLHQQGAGEPQDLLDQLRPYVTKKAQG